MGCDTVKEFPAPDLGGPQNIDNFKKQLIYYRCKGMKAQACPTTRPPSASISRTAVTDLQDPEPVLFHSREMISALFAARRMGIVKRSLARSDMANARLKFMVTQTSKLSLF
jgi:hypothetical protein